MRRWTMWMAAGLAAIGCASCVPSTLDGSSRPPPSARPIVRIIGSDTMASLLQAWAEEYARVRSGVSVRVAGGGSGVGIAALTQGLTDFAAASREMTALESARMPGGRAVEAVVAIDAIAVYVHPTNPLESLALDDLAAVYGDGGAVERWSQLGVAIPRCRSDVVVRIGRQNSSGTYSYFRSAVLGHRREYKLGSIDQSGPKDVVVLTSRTPCAIGYSGLAYASSEVRVLRIATAHGRPAAEPTSASAADGSYPLARRLYLYAATPPTGEKRAFLDWALGAGGQKVVATVGLIPVREIE